MFSLPRDTVDVPIRRARRNVFGSVYRNKINAWWTNIHLRSDLYPGPKDAGLQRPQGHHGNLYKLDIKYFVEVNFDGFSPSSTRWRSDDQRPGAVSDDRFPSVDGKLRRVYIPSGIQHMTGAEALRYARSRHGSNDFDRGVRQQRVLLAPRAGGPAGAHPRLPDLIRRSRRRSPRTSRPTSLHRSSASPHRSTPRASAHTCSRRRSTRMTRAPTARLRRAATSRGSGRPSGRVQRDRRTRRSAGARREGGGVWVLNGTGDTGHGTRLAATSTTRAWRPPPPTEPAGPVPADTTIIAYNGAEAEFPRPSRT